MKVILALVVLLMTIFTFSAFAAEPEAKDHTPTAFKDLSIDQIDLLLCYHLLGRSIMMYNTDYDQENSDSRHNITITSFLLGINLDPDPKTIKTSKECIVAILMWDKQIQKKIDTSIDPIGCNNYFVMGELVGNIITPLSVINRDSKKGTPDPKMKALISRNLTSIRTVAEINQIPADLLQTLKSIETAYLKTKTNREGFDLAMKLFKWSDDLLDRLSKKKKTEK